MLFFTYLLICLGGFVVEDILLKNKLVSILSLLPVMTGFFISRLVAHKCSDLFLLKINGRIVLQERFARVLEELLPVLCLCYL